MDRSIEFTSLTARARRWDSDRVLEGRYQFYFLHPLHLLALASKRDHRARTPEPDDAYEGALQTP